VIFFPAKISESQMHNPRRGRLQDDAIRKIRIFGNDDQFMALRKIPNGCVRWGEPRLWKMEALVVPA
jgi:hypothetical protein